MVKLRTFLFLILFTSPFINLSLFPGSHLPLTVMVMLVVCIPLIANRRVPREMFGGEDLFFLLFWLSSLLSVLINAGLRFSAQGVTQLVNLPLIFFIYKITLFLLFKDRPDPEKLINTVFRYYTYVQVPALIVFAIGMFYPVVNETVIAYFNNAGNFSIGAIASRYPDARITGFSPEPSFWSFFVAVNIAIAFSMRQYSKPLLLINFITLFLTFGRTGYFILACVLIVKFMHGSYWRAVAVALAGVFFLFWIKDSLSISALMSIDDSFRQRVDSVVTAINIALENPFFGIGLGNFSDYAMRQNLDYLNIFNWFLSTIAQSGLIGLLFLLGMFYWIGLRTLAQYRLPLVAALAGWFTVNAYNLPFVWLALAIMVYASAAQRADINTIGNVETAS